jgi:hypothetical protein
MMPAPATNAKWTRLTPAECARKSGEDAVCAGLKFSAVWMGIQFAGACCLPFQTQGINNRPVTVDVFELHIVEQSSASPDQHQQTPTGMMILLVNFQMLGKI